MPVRVKLFYESRDGDLIPPPDDYPEEVLFDDVDSPSELIDEVVQASVLADLFASGAEMLDVIIFWCAENETVH